MSSSRFDPQPPDKSSTGSASAPAHASVPGSTADAAAGVPLGPDGKPIDFLGLIGQAGTISREYQQRTIEKRLSRSYRAWQNDHQEGSKYLDKIAWRGRSKLFVPKTRASVRKNLATAAASLFATDDVINIAATYEDDPEQMATAAVIKADLDYRLTQATHKYGLPWFLISMGGCLDAQLTGVTVSKQFWEFEEVETGEYHKKQVPALHPDTGEPMLDVARDEMGNVTVDPATGMPGIVPIMEEVDDLDAPVMRVVKDRPAVEIHPIENAGIDPAAPWVNPAQLGRWFYMRYPMGLSDARALFASPGKGGRDTAWLPDIPDELLLKGRVDEDRVGARRVREGGADRYQDAKAPGALDIVWMQENFFRVGGKDYHFWSIGRSGYLSRIRETHEAYPEFDGERPYQMGVAQIDTHRIFPMSPVESWQPLQIELNDITNLRQDTLKRSIAPLAMVKRGTKVDYQQLSRRGQPDAVLVMDSLEDVKFEATPGPTGAAYTETSNVNALFDELSGSFSTSSVQTSRQLNETVGGMRLMAGASNSVSEFDLRVWIETWVEPVLRQLVHLVRFNETSGKIVMIAGQKARVMDKTPEHPSLQAEHNPDALDQVLSDFERCELTLRVNVGIGAADPMQKLGKLKMAFEMLAPVYPELKSQGISINGEALVTEVFGQAGFRDGRRFFKFEQPPEQGSDPKLQELMAKMQLEQAKLTAKMQSEREKLQGALQKVMLELQSKERLDAADNRTSLEVANIRAKSALTMQVVDALADREARDHSLGADREERTHDLAVGHLDHLRGGVNRNEDASVARKNRIAEILAKPTARTAAPASPPKSSSSDPAMSQIMSQLDSQGKSLQAIIAHLVAGQHPGQIQPNAGAPYHRA